MERAVGYVYKGGKKISGEMKTNDRIEIKAGHELLDIIWEMYNEARKLCHISEERKQV